MVSTRSGGAKPVEADEKTGDKRSSAPSTAKKPPAKKAKKEADGKLEVGEDGEVGLASKGEEIQDTKAEGMDENGVGDAKMTNERGEDETKGYTDAEPGSDDKSLKAMVEGGAAEGGKEDENGAEKDKEEKAEEKKDTSKSDAARQATPPSGGNDEPAHGTLESGHIYFLYRPKIDADEVDSLDDVSKFHILLIPKSGMHSSGHYHRIIEVGKKKLPDPGAKRQNIWGLVTSTDTDRAALKITFGEYSYETKTKGTRHQQAARPAARGHYILHSPRDEVADSPDHNIQRDFKVLLAYEITTPPPEDFGRVQEELGLEQKGAVVLTVKDPDAGDNAVANPRAANMPREKKAHGAEILLMSSQHDLEDMLGKDGERVEADMDKAAEKEKTDIEGALKELGMGKGDVEIEALEGAWA